MASIVRPQLDYYTALGIDPLASTAEVNRAFRHLAWRYHPDRNPAPGATVQFQDINEAHQALSDPVRRAAYDVRRYPKLHLNCPISSATPHLHSHRRSHRKHRVRAVLLALLAFACVSSAWVAMLTAVASRYHSAPAYSSDLPWSFPSQPLQNSAFSMEAYPSTYTYEQDRLPTPWESDIRSSWGGSADLPTQLDLQPQRALGTAHVWY